ncbi:RNA recognition motif 1 in RNA-binding protein 28 (RBM28)-like protein [Rhizoctonia solani AG-3 Rhs1AP]|uniref:RNA recognition motif 1 in RNA-binding protein 28 (RBM28)-like protein n=1 Tax=Rhizoctonia solani AG-3 Rhs1AP TaxID=1086054 RepID=X8J0W8_9AGAM|nr:RNA recognition motif 1 in RNA-binding protein 28 (RBM28)-like protein [Rhizoctonia solani AG-3 Rhs1AP]
MNGAKIYVGNLSWNTNDDTLRNVFSQYGNVLDSIVMRDRETGRSRGFGFVTYGTQEEATGAINTANGFELDGRQIKVNLANARGASGPGNSAPGMYAPQPGFGGGYGGFPVPAPTGFPSGAPPGGPYGGGFGGYQPQQGNAGGFGGAFWLESATRPVGLIRMLAFNQQGPGGYGVPPTQFPPSQGGYPGGY